MIPYLILVLVLDMQENFKYLDDLIHSGAKKIFLTSDIVLDENEESEYVDGINLDVDDLIIEANGHTIDACGKARIFYITDKRITLKNIVLKNGVGAIYNFKGVLNIFESSILSNAADVAGGAIYNNWGKMNIEDSTISDNASGCHGGAIFNFNGVVNIANSRLSNNSAINDGGAVYSGAELNIRNSVLSKNTANGSGGAIYDNRGEINITESILSENMASGMFGGGAIHKNRGILNIAESTLSNNMADNDGGAIFSIDGDLTITYSEFFNNTSESHGGAIYDNGLLSIADSRLCKNTANCGGSVYTKNKEYLNLNDCIFNDNQPDDVYRE